MIDQKFINDISNTINDMIPEDVKKAYQDVEKNIKTAVQGALTKVDMVPRDEFDAQVQVLAKTRKKLEVLEKQIAKLEKQVAGK